jgi:hypothetical protein
MFFGVRSLWIAWNEKERKKEHNIHSRLNDSLQRIFIIRDAIAAFLFLFLTKTINNDMWLFLYTSILCRYINVVYCVCNIIYSKPKGVGRGYPKNTWQSGWRAIFNLSDFFFLSSFVCYLYTASFFKRFFFFFKFWFCFVLFFRQQWFLFRLASWRKEQGLGPLVGRLYE